MQVRMPAGSSFKLMPSWEWKIIDFQVGQIKVMLEKGIILYFTEMW